MSSTLKAAKAASRKEMKAILNGLSTAEKQRQSLAVTERLVNNPIYKEAQRVSIFLSMHDEVDTSGILKHSLETGKLCFIPRYDSRNRQMDMVRLYSMQDYDKMPETSWKIKQPALDDTSRDDALKTGGLDLVLVPGLAFTRQGHRLGRGRGYYDTFLSSCLSQWPNNPPAMLAVAFTQQLIEKLPTEDTDINVTEVVTAA